MVIIDSIYYCLIDQEISVISQICSMRAVIFNSISITDKKLSAIYWARNFSEIQKQNKTALKPVVS